tara:strand:- start:1120 stop:1473 length:354 start_codon:yes stop_codon:yes gene_type:complete
MNTIALTNRQMIYVNAIIEHGPSLGLDINKVCFTRAELRQVSMALKGKIWIPNWITHDQSRRDGRGCFQIPEVMEVMEQQSTAVAPGHETEADREQDSAPVPSQEEVPCEPMSISMD